MSRYHLTLTDQDANSVSVLLCDARGNTDGRRIGNSIYPRTALQMRQGGAGYEDMELPFITLAQKDWRAGIGGKIFEWDKSRYRWGWNVDTSKGVISKGPKVTSDRPAAYGNENEVREYSHVLEGSYAIYAKFTAYKELINPFILLPIEMGAYGGTVSLLEDDEGEPGDEIYSKTFYQYRGTPPTLGWTGVMRAMAYRVLAANEAPVEGFSFGVPETLTADTDYWVKMATQGPSGWAGVVYDPVSNPLTEVNNVGYADAFDELTMSTDYRMPIFVEGNEYAEEGTFRTIYFEYKSGLYKVVMQTESGAPKLYLNGWRGVAEDNTGELHTLQSGLALAEGVATEAVVRIIEGKSESVPERKIIGMEESVAESGEFDVLLVDRPWKVAQDDNTTCFLIQGADEWNEITGHGLTKPVVDVLVVNDIVFFTQGTGVAMRRMREYITGGAWTRQFAADGTNMFDDLVTVWETDGTSKIYGSKRSTGVISTAEVRNWGTDLTFSKEVRCGYGKITNMVAYGTPRRCYVFKTDEVGFISNDIYQPLPLAEMENVENRLNGQCAVVSDVYLMFSMGEHLQRYYDGRLDDMGPDRDEGLPKEKRGNVTALVGYPGRVFAAVDGGATGNSSILMYNGSGWCCLYSSRIPMQINNLKIESIPGRVDRLWFNDGPYNAWMSIPWNPAQEQNNFLYAASGGVISCWIESGFADIDKYWHAVKIFGDGINAYNTVTVSYQTEDDNEEVWHEAGTADTNGEEILLTSDYSLAGKRLRLKIEYASTTSTKYMEISAVLLYVIERVPVKYQHPIYFIVSGDALDLAGRPSKMDTAATLAQLRAWQDVDSTPLPLTVTSDVAEFNNMVVVLDNLSVDTLEQELRPEHKGKYLCSANLLEV